MPEVDRPPNMVTDRNDVAATYAAYLFSRMLISPKNPFHLRYASAKSPFWLHKPRQKDKNFYSIKVPKVSKTKQYEQERGRKGAGTHVGGGLCMAGDADAGEEGFWKWLGQARQFHMSQRVATLLVHEARMTGLSRQYIAPVWLARMANTKCP